MLCSTVDISSLNNNDNSNRSETSLSHTFPPLLLHHIVRCHFRSAGIIVLAPELVPAFANLFDVSHSVKHPTNSHC
ncbi:hypothetical protein TYRP_001418 [Tyrophagus putrescentiae]|nr:hypothetical protein TYRP_001418 [Tyrophagus putrescentiae]